jgi:hypothetical protein
MATVVTPHATSQSAEILSESIEYLNRVRIPVWWHGHEHLAGADVDPRSTIFQNRPVFETHALSSLLRSIIFRLRLLFSVV